MAAPNWKKPPPQDEPEDWLVTYADAITLLMAFFVMLVSFSKIDIPLYERVAAGISEEIGKQDYRVSPTELLKIDLQDVVYTLEADEVVDVATDDRGIVLELSSSAFYKPGSADIRDEAIPVLSKMAQALSAPRYRNYVIEVEGHTDDDPISTVRFPSNWELSAGRATRVVRFFVSQGMEASRMKAAGFAETRPKVPNRTPEGAPIPENQAQNRRVVVRAYPMSLEEREEQARFMEIEEFTSETPESAAPTPDFIPRGQGVRSTRSR